MTAKKKAIMKLYKDSRRWVQERTFEEGDEVRVKVVLSQSKEQPRKSVVTYKVTKVRGTQITAYNKEHNHEVTRNISCFEKVYRRAVQQSVGEATRSSEPTCSYTNLEKNTQQSSDDDIQFISWSSGRGQGQQRARTPPGQHDYGFRIRPFPQRRIPPGHAVRGVATTRGRGRNGPQQQ